MVSLELRDIGVRLGRADVLSGLSAGPFQAAEMVAVIGPNAAGKSTLLRRIAGLLAGSGQVLAEGRMAYMPQQSAVGAALSVYEAVLLARKQGRESWRIDDRDMAAVDAALDALDLAELASRSIGALSGGQMQMVGLAQALAREPDILLLDEPTSALDLHRSHEVLALLRRWCRERGLIVLAALHDLNQVLRYCDQALVIAEGRLVAQGDVSQVLTADLLRAVYQVRARLEPCSQGIGHLIIDGAL